ncbi:MAG: hypothetical protein Q7T04_07845 [Dehalococcoidia bacterium]|nr:hypothetical protein [Dehalococcoidia bacterium]
MEKKGLEYDPIFKVPEALRDRHEICMQEITGNPRHANDVLTRVTARGASNYETSRAEMDDLLKQYLPLLEKDPRTKRLDIAAGGAVIGGLTNSPNVQRMEPYNWPQAPHGVKPQAMFYLVIDVPDKPPHFWYCPETRTALSINSSYYGEKKSRGLGIGMDILQPMGIHSIHGSCLDIDGRGVVIVAPTGTGKSTLCAMLKDKPGARIHSDDWLYVMFNYDEEGRPRLAIGRYSELWYYMRTDTALSQPVLGEIFPRCPIENVPVDEAGNYVWNAFENSRAMVNSLDIAGGGTAMEKQHKLARFTSIEKVVFLRREEGLPEVERLTPENAIHILYEGKMRYLSGSGKTGAGVERWLNPYVLVNKENLIDHKGERALLNIDFQNYFFATLFAVTGGAYYLNTANKTPAQSLKALEEIVAEPSCLALHFDPYVYRTRRIEEAFMKCSKESPEEVVATLKRFMGSRY